MPKFNREEAKMSQLGLFQAEELKQCQVESKTTVRLGKRSAQVPLARKNREALVKLKEILAQLEGKDILVSQHCDFWWHRGLRLSRLDVQWGSHFYNPELDRCPAVIVLLGRGNAEIRILHPERLYQVREQCYGKGKTEYLLDFWNGFWGHPISSYQRHYDCLHIKTVN
jgi:hypothetical protein